MMNKALFDLTMKNIITVGDKKLAYIPTLLLFADFRFQRRGKKAKRKIEKLAVCWDGRKMDALRVVAHPDTYNFSVVDGWHRYNAAIINKINYLVCEIIDASPDEEERLVEEATLFALQNDNLDPLTPMEMHKANVIRNVPENVELQRLIEKYGIEISEGQERSIRRENYLTGFAEALRMTRVDKETTDKVFYIICSAGWNLSYGGLGNSSLRSLYNILRLHKGDSDRIAIFLKDYLRGIDPKLFFSFAAERYPERKEIERIIMFTEDIIVENLNIERVYNGGTIKIAA